MCTVAKFEYKGNEYDYNGVCKVKVDDSWIDAVMYSRNGHTYVRELLNFMINFTCVEAKNPMPGDTWLRRRKTVADIIKDQLGPGYVARGHEGGRPIMVEEVECGDCVQNNSKTADEYFQEVIKLKQKKINDEDSGRAK